MHRTCCSAASLVGGTSFFDSAWLTITFVGTGFEYRLAAMFPLVAKQPRSGPDSMGLDNQVLTLSLAN